MLIAELQWWKEVSLSPSVNGGKLKSFRLIYQNYKELEGKIQLEPGVILFVCRQTQPLSSVNRAQSVPPVSLSLLTPTYLSEFREHVWPGLQLRGEVRDDLAEWRTAEVRDEYKYTMIVGVHAQKESFMDEIIILVTPAPVLDPSPAWKLPILVP